MKSKLTLLLVVLSLGMAKAQVFSDIAEVSVLPENMPKVKHWCSLMLNKMVVMDLKTSSSYRGDATSLNFRLRGGEQSLLLPATGGIVAYFKQKGTTKNAWLASTGTFNMNYKRELLAYSRLALSDFKHNDRFFDFQLGMDILHLSDDQMVAQVLNYFIETDKGTAEKFELLRKQLNAKMKVNIPVPSVRDDLRAFMVVLSKQFKGEALQQAIFKTYIQGKTLKDTDRNLSRFFDRTSGPFADEHVPSKLSKLNDPYFELAAESEEQLRIPYSLLKMSVKEGDSVFRYDYQYLVGRFDLLAGKLELTFKGRNLRAVPITSLKLQDYDFKTKVSSWKSPVSGLDREVMLKQLVLSISEDKIELIGKDEEESSYLIAFMNWPSNFLKTTLADWKK